MKLLIVFALTLAYVSLVSTASVLQDQAENVGIINGHDASPGQFPYQVQLINHLGYMCGGSLIGHEWVLTSAFCAKLADNVTVHLGSVRRSAPLVTRFASEKDIISHPGFNSNFMYNDIALVRIPYVKYSKNLQPVKLPKIQPLYHNYAGSEATITGWGATTNTSTTASEILQYAKVKVIKNVECKAKAHIIDFNQICASSASGASPWGGDIGGPLVELPGLSQIGITSFVINMEDNIGGFTRVTSYLGWIKFHTGLPL
ncbi:collagenase-like [Drosophila albomicans]|uniref:Collagenase-like n=1 Tax=Drosophila albomicans TaxID=7291 RepID=A0A6P8XBU5_DROAB|nr:collagenase-like [Drosophila albomicans]